MGRKVGRRKQEDCAQLALTARLDLIRKRHRELILKPRETIAADFGAETDDPYEPVLGADEMELVEAVGASRY